MPVTVENNNNVEASGRDVVIEEASVGVTGSPANAGVVMDTLVAEGSDIALRDAAASLTSAHGFPVVQSGILKLATGTQLTTFAGTGGLLIDYDAGQHNAGGTTSPVSLIATAITQPAADAVGDGFLYMTSGAMVNLTGGPLDCELHAQFGSSSLWTPYALTCASFTVTTWQIRSYYFINAIGAAAVCSLETDFVVTNTTGETRNATASRTRHVAITVNNTSTIAWTITADHSGSSTSFDTNSTGHRLIKIA